MGISQIIRNDDSVTVITDEGHASTAEQHDYWSDSTNNDMFNSAVEDALSKD